MSEQPTEAQSTNAQAAVAQLEKELRARAVKRVTGLVGVVAVLAAAIAGWYYYQETNKPAPKPRFTTAGAELRDIVEQVESTGRLKPLTQVQVGAQVSGRVVKVQVDFNSQVKKGDLLAEIDPQLFGAQVGQVSGQLRAAKANRERAKHSVSGARINYDRLTRLAQEGIATKAELDQAKSTLDIATADLSAAEATILGLSAQLRSARTTLQYTKIHSPIDGVVINRAVEPGQTVASSLSAPVLFEIAQDLKKMQVLADIDEADVGKLKEGMSASVSVDAFVGEVFHGRVTQIRYSPNEVQGVVTYSAVIDVENPELKLRPGMTATVAITTSERKQALAMPNAALRFRPDDKAKVQLKPLKKGQAHVYQVAGGAPGQETLKVDVVNTGVTDGVWTEVLDGPVEPGTALVTEQRDKEKKRRRFMGIF